MAGSNRSILAFVLFASVLATGCVSGTRTLENGAVLHTPRTNRDEVLVEFPPVPVADGVHEWEIPALPSSQLVGLVVRPLKNGSAPVTMTDESEVAAPAFAEILVTAVVTDLDTGRVLADTTPMHWKSLRWRQLQGAPGWPVPDNAWNTRGMPVIMRLTDLGPSKWSIRVRLREADIAKQWADQLQFLIVGQKIEAQLATPSRAKSEE